MLDPKDCKLGIEVVCIGQKGVLGPRLTIGGDYTIHEFFPKGTLATGPQAGWPFPLNSISLNEVERDEEGNVWCYDIACFKLKYDPKALEIFKFKETKELEPA